MKPILYIIVCLACLCWQCKEKKDPAPQPSEIKEIDVLDFTVPGVDAKNILVNGNVIVVNLPENYAKGNYIKPEIILGTGYSTQSELTNGMAYEGRQIKLTLESTSRQPRTFDVIVIPHKAIELTQPAENVSLTFTGESFITASFGLKGTSVSVNDSGRIVSQPLIRLIDKSSGQIAQTLYADAGYTQAGQALKFSLPPATTPGDYTAEIVWGTKTALLSPQLTIKAGALQLARGSWHMLEGEGYFQVTGFNLSATSKYEAIIENELTKPRRIALQYQKPGVLFGNLPEQTPAGNYKITYLVDGKQQTPYTAKAGIELYRGDDNFYIQKTSTQPILRMLTQPSRQTSASPAPGYDLYYYESAKEVNRQEPILAYIESQGAFPSRNELVLVNQKTRAEYVLPYSGDSASLFDGFVMFLSYNITTEVPDGTYEVYAVRGTEKTEKYSQIITLK